jgi:hypothetical protein
MVGGMFAVTTMSCWGKMFIEVGTEFGLLGKVPWCAMVVCSVACEVVVMALA